MSGNENDASDASPPWAELPADLVSEIKGLVGEAGDFVRFHAVCRPWRQAPPPLTPSIFLPCLIAQKLLDKNRDLHLHSPFSAAKHRHARTSTLAGKTIECSDASRDLVLAVDSGSLAELVLINPLTGDATSLPELPQIMYPMHDWSGQRSTATVSNGIVMLNTNVASFAVFSHRPGETGDWEEVDVTTCPTNMNLNYAPHLDRRALTLSCVLRGGTSAVAKLPPALPKARRYVVESHGELLCLDVVLGNTQPEFGVCRRRRANASISVTVHALEVNLQDGRPWWVEREHGRGLEHVCFFLNGGSGSGFTVDAREFTGGEVVGGCAYLVGEHMKETIEGRLKRGYAVYGYRFKDATATVVDVLPDGFGGHHGFVSIRFMWYMPRPTISAVRFHHRHER